MTAEKYTEVKIDNVIYSFSNNLKKTSDRKLFQQVYLGLKVNAARRELKRRGHSDVSIDYLALGIPQPNFYSADSPAGRSAAAMQANPALRVAAREAHYTRLKKQGVTYGVGLAKRPPTLAEAKANLRKAGSRSAGKSYMNT